MEDSYISLTDQDKTIQKKSKFDLLGLTKQQLMDVFSEISLPDFRTKQVWRWV